VHASQLALSALAAVGVVIVDQVTKAAAQRWLPEAPRRTAVFARLELVHNYHGGIGKLAVPRTVAASVGTVVIALAVVLIAVAGPLSALTLAGLGVSIGGGLSNIGDLAMRGRIVDFVAIWRWPAFNLADVAICVGLVFTWIGLL
jgi:signal peptidase II